MNCISDYFNAEKKKLSFLKKEANRSLAAGSKAKDIPEDNARSSTETLGLCTKNL